MERFIYNLEMLRAILESKVPEGVKSNGIANATISVIKAFQKQLERAEKAEAQLAERDAVVKQLIEAGNALGEMADPDCETEESAVWWEIVFEWKEDR